MKQKTYTFLIFVLLSFFLIACYNEENEIDINTIKIYNNIDDSYEEYTLNDNEFNISDLPTYSDNNRYLKGYSLTDNGKLIKEYKTLNTKDNNTIYAIFGIEKGSFKIGSIPTIYINASEEIKSKETYVSANISIQENGFYTMQETDVNIRIRGNSSSGVAKKSFKLKFEKKIDMFGMGKDKEWALIANYFDPSHLRNFYAYKLAKLMGMEYAVDCQFVNVYLNNSYQGLYLFTETVKTSSNRVDIEVDYTQDDYDIPFMLELDYKLEENNPNYMDTLDIEFFFVDNTKYSGRTFQYATHYPKYLTTDYITTKQYEFIKKYMNNTYESVSIGTYNNYIDLESFIDYFLIQELFMNIDQEHSSVYVYRKQYGKLQFGPIWDFDLSTGNCSYVYNYNPYHSMKQLTGGNYLFSTLINDKKVHDLFIERLKEIENDIILDMLDSFEHNYSQLALLQQQDNAKWKTLNQSNWARPDYLTTLTYKEQVMYLKNYLSEHYYWMIKNM